MAMITAYGLEIPRQALSLDRFREWLGSMGESAPRMCFSSGRLHIEMSTQDYKTHAPVVDAINDVLSSLTKERQLGRYFRHPMNEVGGFQGSSCCWKCTYELRRSAWELPTGATQSPFQSPVTSRPPTLPSAKLPLVYQPVAPP